jgi:hypothetical protein
MNEFWDMSFFFTSSIWESGNHVYNICHLGFVTFVWGERMEQLDFWTMLSPDILIWEVGIPNLWDHIWFHIHILTIQSIFNYQCQCNSFSIPCFILILMLISKLKLTLKPYMISRAWNSYPFLSFESPLITHVSKKKSPFTTQIVPFTNVNFLICCLFSWRSIINRMYDR